MFESLKQKVKNFWANTKGAFDQLGGAALALVVFVIILALGALVLGTVAANSTVTANGNATLAVANGLEGLSDLSDWTDIIVIVIVFAVILGLVYGFYRSRQ